MWEIRNKDKSLSPVIALVVWASLSEPHMNVKYVCMYVCIFRCAMPYVIGTWAHMCLISYAYANRLSSRLPRLATKPSESSQDREV